MDPAALLLLFILTKGPVKIRRHFLLGEQIDLNTSVYLDGARMQMSYQLYTTTNQPLVRYLLLFNR